MLEFREWLHDITSVLPFIRGNDQVCVEVSPTGVIVRVADWQQYGLIESVYEPVDAITADFDFDQIKLLRSICTCKYFYDPASTFTVYTSQAGVPQEIRYTNKANSNIWHQVFPFDDNIRKNLADPYPWFKRQWEIVVQDPDISQLPKKPSKNFTVELRNQDLSFNFDGWSAVVASNVSGNLTKLGKVRWRSKWITRLIRIANDVSGACELSINTQGFLKISFTSACGTHSFITLAFTA